MHYYLMVWTMSFVTFSTSGYSVNKVYEWKNVAGFTTEDSYQKAAAPLGYTDNSKWRCVRTY